MHDISKMRQARKRQKLFRAAVRWMTIAVLFGLSWFGLCVLLVSSGWMHIREAGCRMC